MDSLPEGVLLRIVQAANRNGDGRAVSSTYRRLKELYRSSVPVPDGTLCVKGRSSRQALSELKPAANGGLLPFPGVDRLVMAAAEGIDCYLMMGLWPKAARLMQIVSLDLCLSPTPPWCRISGLKFSRDAEDALAPISQMQQLRKVKLTTTMMTNSCAASLASLKGLTSLHIKESGMGYYWGMDNLLPLSKLGRLMEFTAEGAAGPIPPEVPERCRRLAYALPPSLRRLSLKGGTAHWLRHISNCPRLEELHLDYSGATQYASAHPAAVLALAAEHTKGLRRLTCPWVKGATFTAQLQDQPADGTLEQPLLPDVLSVLTGLQQLDVGRYLSISSTEHWTALGRLSALTSLQGILVEGGPPPGWRHSGVKQLGAVVRLPGHEAAAASFALAFPAVRVADLRGVAGGGAVQYCLPALGGMASLEELLVDGVSAPPPTAAAAAAAAGGPRGLPSSLLRLQVEGETAGGWLQHLPAAPRLTELLYEYDSEQHTSTHPAAVLELAARHTPRLCRLTCLRPTSSGSSSGSSGNLGQQKEASQQLPPPEAQQQPPPGVALAALTSLRHLNAGGYLSVSKAGHWQALGHLTALTSLQGIVVDKAPPRPWRLKHVQQLSVVLEDVGGGSAARLLLGFPSVKQAQVCVVNAPAEQQPASYAVFGSSAQQGVPPVLSLLSSLQLEYPGKYEAGMSPAVHAAPMLSAARGVEDLSFDGECAQQGGGVLLPDLSGVTGVTRLRFGRSEVWDKVATVGDVVAMVQPLGRTLRVLDLSSMGFKGPAAVLALQEVLPRLKEVLLGSCAMAFVDGGKEWRHIQGQLRGDVMITICGWQMYR